MIVQSVPACTEVDCRTTTRVSRTRCSTKCCNA